MGYTLNLSSKSPTTLFLNPFSHFPSFPPCSTSSSCSSSCSSSYPLSLPPPIPRPHPPNPAFGHLIQITIRAASIPPIPRPPSSLPPRTALPRTTPPLPPTTALTRREIRRRVRRPVFVVITRRPRPRLRSRARVRRTQDFGRGAGLVAEIPVAGDRGVGFLLRGVGAGAGRVAGFGSPAGFGARGGGLAG